ncbi:unnamed protein product [Heterotrigona itama]|uniref:Uncharacterized protein n=1 Tax=Heterotrigona itama TaxID=395501 RepID=A0A6V7H3P4_9HYME|nr:unnamed protein product [Heterotrigona itama]
MQIVAVVSLIPGKFRADRPAPDLSSRLDPGQSVQKISVIITNRCWDTLYVIVQCVIDLKKKKTEGMEDDIKRESIKKGIPEGGSRKWRDVSPAGRPAASRYSRVVRCEFIGIPGR